MLVQDVEAVQMGVIKYLAKFLSTLPEPCRVSYLPLLHDILHSTNPFNWRMRQHLARQLPDLVELPPRHETYRTLFPTVMILLQDPVASVRLETFRGVTALINNLRDSAHQEASKSEDQIDTQTLNVYVQNIEDVVRAINSFAVGDKFQLRQLWLDLCSQLLRDLPRPFFEENFVEGVLALTIDPVANVRIAVSRFFAAWEGDYLPPWINDPEALLPPAKLSSLSVGICQADADADAGTEKDADADAGEGASAPATAAASATAPATAAKVANAESTAEAEAPKLTMGPWHWLLRRTDIRYCLERLASDDPEVFLNLSKIQPLYPDLIFSSVSCRGRKTPPGGITPIPIDPNPFIDEGDEIIDHSSGHANLMNSNSSITALSALLETASQVSSLVGGPDDDTSMVVPEDQLHMRNADSTSSIASAGSSGVRSRSSSNPARSLLASTFSAEGDAASVSSTSSLPRNRSRNGSITAPEIHLEPMVDISPVEIEKISGSMAPPMPDLDFSTALSAAAAAVAAEGGGGTHTATIMPTEVAPHIVADELELFGNFSPTGRDSYNNLEAEASPTNASMDPLVKKSFDQDDEADEEDGMVPYKDPLTEAEMQEMMSDCSIGSNNSSSKKSDFGAKAAENGTDSDAASNTAGDDADAAVDAEDVYVHVDGNGDGDTTAAEAEGTEAS